MHIPDGYLSPVFSLGMGLATIPAWGIATNKVQKVLDNRTAPLLAVFAAFVFTIQMFNIPVPGGTTAHGVGGTLLAIVLGPWAAVIGVSVALIIQALFFGDGGIIAVFANCFNMGVVLPFTGYAIYLLVAGNSSILSRRRVWAAGIGAYAGITVAGLLVGLELGLQPILFTDASGQPLYSPYGLEAALPAMLLTHVLGASIVEALITALGLAYLQRTHPDFLTLTSQGAQLGETAEAGSFSPLVAGLLTFGAAVLFVLGMITGNGDVGTLFGVDWASVDWPSVASMLLVTTIIAAILIPLAWFVLPAPVKRVGTLFVALAVIAPLGLITPGFAYGEGSAEDLHAEFGYVPEGFEQFSSIFSAPLADYNIPLPFFNEADAELWHQAVGYEIAGILGILLVIGVCYGIAKLLKRPDAGSDQPHEAAG